MALTHSPSIVRNGLVFYYDMNNTQRSWKGMPVTNLYSVAASDSANNIIWYWANASYTANATFVKTTSYGTWNGNTIFKCTVDSGTLAPWASIRNCFPSSYDSTYGTTRRLSFKVKMLTGNISSVGFHNGGGTGGISWGAPMTENVVPQDVIGKSGWYSYDMDASGPWPSGHCVGVGVVGNNIEFLVTELMVSTSNIATSFTPTVRSNTQAIVDLTGNNTITASSLTYDSDGTFRFASGNIISCAMTKTSSITFSGWAKTTIAPASQSAMLFNAGPAGTGPDLYFYGGQLYWNIWDGATNPLGAIPTSSNDGKYHNYVLVNDSSTNAKLYYDGNLLGTAIYRSATANTSFYIGGAGDGGYSWIGNIGMFGIHNRALTAAEVLQNFEATRSRYGV